MVIWTVSFSSYNRLKHWYYPGFTEISLLFICIGSW